EECDYDGGDCCECHCQDGDFECSDNVYFPCKDPDANRTCEEYPGCSYERISWIGSGRCSDGMNNAECDYDGGDCCECECQQAWCGSINSFTCLDPEADRSCEAYPTCMGTRTTTIGNAICKEDLNNEECGYDGGDCCECDCE
ncbi:unnamed protein product, partial [Pylaiella littoralis]